MNDPELSAFFPPDLDAAIDKAAILEAVKLYAAIYKAFRAEGVETEAAVGLTIAVVGEDDDEPTTGAAL